jgi:hypothetical protein
MTTASTSRWPAILCALLLLLCALATFPIAETGMNDDWSYATTARILAQTGHIVYNGWGAPILGWQLFLGALFIKLFGPSFAAIRASTLLVALITAFLTQRTLVRAGITSRSATIGTLTLVLSPFFLPLALSFMTDLGGLFCIVLCLYACLRALQAHSNPTVLAWLAFAALSNAVGGTVRQIVWLGVLVMFPCTVWLLRRRPHVLLFGSVLYAISILIIYGILHWFQQQPHTVPEPLFIQHLGWSNLKSLTVMSLSLFLSFALFLLPILIAFIPASSPRNRRSEAFLVIGGLLCLAATIYLFLYHLNTLNSLFAPFKGGTVSQYGLVAPVSIKGWHSAPKVLSPALRILITIPVLAALLCFLDFLRTTRRLSPLAQNSPAVSPPVSWPTLLVLIVPFLLAYLVLLIPRGLSGDVYDRYLLPIFPLALIFLLRIYQDRVRPNLPVACIALVLLFALFAVAAEHDSFNSYRARLAAIGELRAAGIPDTSIDAGWEHNAMTQIDQFGYLNEKYARLPVAAARALPSSFPSDCRPERYWLTPAIVPGYALSFVPDACGGPSRFAPVTYSNWIGPRNVTFYIVNTVKPASTQR